MHAKGKPYVVCTGGEPLLQLDEAGGRGAARPKASRSGSRPTARLLPPPGIDWICVSPKADAEQKLTRGDELKLIYPQEGAPPERFAGQDFAHFFLQPMDNAVRAANTQAATAYCLAHPQWRLSLQTHKFWESSSSRGDQPAMGMGHAGIRWIVIDRAKAAEADSPSLHYEDMRLSHGPRADAGLSCAA